MDYTEIYLRKNKKQLEKITSYTVLYSALFVSIFSIFLIFSYAIYNGKVLDPEVNLTPISEKQLAELSNVKVETGIFIRDFSRFDMLKNSFIAQASIWFSFNPNAVDKGLIDQFSFENGSLRSKSKVREIKMDDRILALYEIELEFQGIFDYSHFSLDQHRLNLILVNPVSSPQQILYVVENESVAIAEKAFTEGWSLTGKTARFGYQQEDLKIFKNQIKLPIEKTVFSYSYKHSSSKELIIIFIPLILMFLVGLLSLLLDMVFDSRVIIELAVGATLALVFIYNYIRTFTPVTGVFTLVDAFYVLLMLITSAIFLVQIFSLHYYRRKQSETQLKEVLDFTLSSLNIFRSGMYLFILCAFIFISFYILAIR